MVRTCVGVTKSAQRAGKLIFGVVLDIEGDVQKSQNVSMTLTLT